MHKLNPIVVLSLSRSGSSLLSRILNEVLNIDFGEPIQHLPPNKFNPYGYFENFDVLKINNDILSMFNSDVFNPPAIDYYKQVDVDVNASFTHLIHQALKLINPENKLYGVKDPRLALTLPVWRDAYPCLVPIIIYRNPSAAASSIMEQNPQVGMDKAYMLWFDYYYRIFYYTSGLRRYITSFEYLIQNSFEVVSAIAVHLGLTIDSESIKSKLATIIEPGIIKFQKRAERVDLSPYIDAKTKFLYMLLENDINQGKQPDFNYLGSLIKGLYFFENEYPGSLVVNQKSLISDYKSKILIKDEEIKKSVLEQQQERQRVIDIKNNEIITLKNTIQQMKDDINDKVKFNNAQLDEIKTRLILETKNKINDECRQKIANISEKYKRDLDNIIKEHVSVLKNAEAQKDELNNEHVATIEKLKSDQSLQLAKQELTITNTYEEKLNKITVSYEQQLKNLQFKASSVSQEMDLVLINKQKEMIDALEIQQRANIEQISSIKAAYNKLILSKDLSINNKLYQIENLRLKLESDAKVIDIMQSAIRSLRFGTDRLKQEKNIAIVVIGYLRGLLKKKNVIKRSKEQCAEFIDDLSFYRDNLPAFIEGVLNPIQFINSRVQIEEAVVDKLLEARHDTIFSHILFDEEAYLQQNQDIARAVNDKLFTSGVDHWNKIGKFEVLLGLRKYRHPALDVIFDEEEYLKQNPDVVEAINSGAFKSGWQHWIIKGWHETVNNQRSYAHPWQYKPFDDESYCDQNLDVAIAVEAGIFSSAHEHWLRYGWKEVASGQRSYRHPLYNMPFDETSYLEQNSDVAAAIHAGQFVSGKQHWEKIGWKEVKHKLREYVHPAAKMPFDEASYVEQNQDVSEAISKGKITSGIVHWYNWGWREVKDGKRAYVHPSCQTFFDAESYLEQNQDVAKAVQNGQITSALEHWQRTGWREVKEGRRSYIHPAQNLPFNEQLYLDQNPDIALGVSVGKIVSGTDHWMRIGWHEVQLKKRSYKHIDFPKFSIIAAVYNKSESLSVFIEAFRNQKYYGSIELIFIDDLSTDNSRDIILTEANSPKNNNNFKIKLIVNESNRGNCYSRLRGIPESSGQIICIIDADCIVNNTFVEHHRASHHNKFYQIVVGAMNIETNGRDPFLLLSELSNDNSKLNAEMDLQDSIFKDSFLNNITRNFSIKREFVDSKLFDINFSYSLNTASGFGWEDVDMGYRLYQRGLRTTFNSKAISVHLSHPSSIDDNSKPIKSIKNYRKLFEKHPGLECIAPDWGRLTLTRLDNWLKSVNQNNNEDFAALNEIFQRPETPYSFNRKTTRRLKILSYRWHCSHQYELHRLPHDFTLAQAGCITNVWDYKQRPLRENAQFVPLSEIQYDDYDLAILHFDEFILDSSLANGILAPDWGQAFIEIFTRFNGPKVAICHGVPYFYGACDLFYDSALRGKIIEKERKKIRDFLGETLVITNSHRAQLDWGFSNSRVIWHGFDPKEYPPATYDKNSLIAIGHLAKRPYYRGLNQYLKIMDILNDRNVPLPDFLGDAFYNAVKLPTLNRNEFVNDNEYGRACFINYITFMRQYSVFLNTTMNSPMPRTRAEAMLCGLAVVTTNSHDESMFIDNEENGFYSNDPKQLAHYMETLYKEPGLARKIGEAGRRRAMDIFHINDYLNEWNDVLSTVLGQSIAPDNITRPERYSRVPQHDHSQPSVLFVGGVGGDTERYRIDHMIEGLRQVGVNCRKLSFTSSRTLESIPDAADKHDIIVLHRVPYSSLPSSFLTQMQNKNKLLIFDTDDLVFDPAFPEYFEKIGICEEGFKGLVPAYQETIKLCNFATCTTSFLKDRLESYNIDTHIIRNCYSNEMARLSALARESVIKSTEWIEIGYPSGTPTHRLDFASISSALAAIMSEFDDVRLHIVGHLELPKILKPHRDRIIRTEFVSWKKLPRLIAGFHVNIAPLVENEDFCQAKSELKWLEAALVEVPSICSRTNAFNNTIFHMEDGLLASGEEQWYEALKLLITDHALRTHIGHNALTRVLESYGSKCRGLELADLFKTQIAQRM